MKQILEIKEQANKIRGAADLFKQIDKVNIDFKQENLILVCLDTKNKVVHQEIMFKGGLSSCVVDSRIVFRTALKHNSSSIIVAHNHPSGDLTPSIEDKDVFNMIVEAGNIVGIKCLDSIIFNKKEFFSMGGC